MHTKIQGHWPFGSEKKMFLVLPYIAMAAILVMWPGPFEQTFVPPSHRSSIWNLTLIGPVVSEEKMLKECGRRRTTTYDRQRTTEAYLSYKLTIWAFDSGELIKGFDPCTNSLAFVKVVVFSMSSLKQSIQLISYVRESWSLCRLVGPTLLHDTIPAERQMKIHIQCRWNYFLPLSPIEEGFQLMEETSRSRSHDHMTAFSHGQIKMSNF